MFLFVYIIQHLRFNYIVITNSSDTIEFLYFICVQVDFIYELNGPCSKNKVKIIFLKSKNIIINILIQNKIIFDS